MQETQQPLKLTGLSMAELQRLLDETDSAIAERRVEELKVLADGYAKKLAMNGFSIREGMDALRPYLRIKNVMPRAAE
jgi:DNA-binding protein H-NS